MCCQKTNWSKCEGGYSGRSGVHTKVQKEWRETERLNIQWNLCEYWPWETIISVCLEFTKETRMLPQFLFTIFLKVVARAVRQKLMNELVNEKSYKNWKRRNKCTVLLDTTVYAEHPKESKHQLLDFRNYLRQVYYKN